MIINFTVHHLMLIYTNRISYYFCIALLCTQYCLIIKTKTMQLLYCNTKHICTVQYSTVQYMHTHTT